MEAMAAANAMKETLLGIEDVLAGYDAVTQLYPYVPSLSHWRAWEQAAYRRFRLEGRVLDLGCGDGRYFKLLWPGVRDAVGVDASAGVADAAAKSGVYTRVHHAPAHEIPEADRSVDAVFANCSLEHMLRIDDVLGEIHRCLVPGGKLLCSVVTDRFVGWSVLPLLVGQAGGEALARRMRDQHVAYHELANPFTVAQWRDRFAGAGLEVDVHIPILPRFNSSLFLLADAAWHVKLTDGGEIGDHLYPALSANPGFPGAFRLVLEGVLRMETDWRECSGAVFSARRAR